MLHNNPIPHPLPTLRHPPRARGTVYPRADRLRPPESRVLGRDGLGGRECRVIVSRVCESSAGLAYSYPFFFFVVVVVDTG